MIELEDQDEWDKGWWACYEYLSPQLSELKQRIESLENTLEANMRTIKHNGKRKCILDREGLVG